MQSLRQSMNDWARQLAAQGVSEEALVVIRRDRLCVPVKAGRQVQQLIDPMPLFRSRACHPPPCALLLLCHKCPALLCSRALP